MSNISVPNNQNYAVLQNQENHIGKISGDNNSHQSSADNVQTFATLAIHAGMMATILQGNSVMVNLDMRPPLLAPSVDQKKIDSVQRSNLMNLISTMKEHDVNMLERVAALAATIFITQAGQLYNISNTTNGNKILPVSTPSTAPGMQKILP